MTVHLISPPRVDFAIVERVLGRRKAKRLAALHAEAQKHARAQREVARQEAEAIMAYDRAEAAAILAILPDFAALEAAPAKKGKSAFQAIRDVADRYGLAMAAVTGKGRDDRILAVRAEAVRAVKKACPSLMDAEIGKLFSDLSAARVHRAIGGDVR